MARSGTIAKILNALGIAINPATEEKQNDTIDAINNGSFADTNNSTETLLTSGQVFTGTSTDILHHSGLLILLNTDVSGTLMVQYSADEVTWHDGEKYEIPANSTKFFTPPVQGAYFRVIYTNGVSDQGTFHLHTIVKRRPVKWSSHNLNDNLRDDDDGELVINVLKLRTAQDNYVSGAATSSGNFKISLEELENSISVNENTQLKVTNFDSSGNEVSGKIYDENTSTYKGLLFNEGSPQVCSQDYLLSLSEGDITGHTPFSKFGRVSAVSNTLVDVWINGTGTPSQYVFPPSAIQFHVVSTSAQDGVGGTGILTLRLEGLDSNYAVITEDITMNGITPVTTTNSFLRINFCYALTAGSTGAAVGTITVKNTADTITYSVISPGMNVCRQLIYTVPAGKTLYLTSLTIASGQGGNSLNVNAVIFTPKYRLVGGSVFYPAGELLAINSETIRTLEIPGKFTEKTDIKMSVIGDYASASSTCIGAVRGWLE